MIGPGYYDLNDSLIAKYRGGAVPYNADSSKRSKIEIQSPSKNVGPGSYNIPTKINAALYQIDPHHQTSVFVSNTKRITDPYDELKKLK